MFIFHSVLSLLPGVAGFTSCSLNVYREHCVTLFYQRKKDAIFFYLPWRINNVNKKMASFFHFMGLITCLLLVIFGHPCSLNIVALTFGLHPFGF